MYEKFVVLRLTRGELTKWLDMYNMYPELAVTDGGDFYYVVTHPGSIEITDFYTTKHMVSNNLELLEALQMATTLARRPFTITPL